MYFFDLLSHFTRTLISHLLLLVWWVHLLLAFAGALAWPLLPTLLLPLLLLLGVAFWMGWAFYYPPRKLLIVHLLGFLAGLLALVLHPLLIPVAFLITLGALAYPCRHCIRLQWPTVFKEAA